MQRVYYLANQLAEQIETSMSATTQVNEKLNKVRFLYDPFHSFIYRSPQDAIISLLVATNKAILNVTHAIEFVSIKL